MRKILGGAIIALVVLFAGCISVDYDQKIGKDGSSVLTDTADISALTSYMDNLSANSNSLNTAAPYPDSTYEPKNYEALPSFESNSISIGLQNSYYGDDPLQNLSPGKSPYLTFEIKNNGEERLQDISVQFKSGALVIASSYYGDEEYVGDLEKRDITTVTFYPTVANVTPGTYYATIIAQYDTPTKNNVTVAEKISFVVKAAESEEPVNLEDTYQEICTNVTENDPAVTCNYADGKFVLSKNTAPDGDRYIFRKDVGLFETVYDVKITGIPQALDESAMGEGESMDSYSLPNTTSNKFEDGLGGSYSPAVLKQMMKLTYTVHMPAKITNATDGKISTDGMSVTYDLLDLYDKKESIEIVAVEENSFMKTVVSGGVVVFVLIVGAAVLLWFLGRKK